MAQKRSGRGRPPKDDEEAIQYVLAIRREHPAVGYREAARRYFKRHPKKLTAKAESEARRVGEKAARRQGRYPTATELVLLRRLGMHLGFAIQAIQQLIDRWQRVGRS
jgi:hypothetical protein